MRILLFGLLALAGRPQETDEAFVVFSINVQDFSYSKESAATLHRILDLHEKHRVPVDLYFTTTMTDLYEAEAPDLLQRLKVSKIATVCYHVRPPKPYYLNYDWSGLGSQSPARQKEIVAEYESHGVDLATGKPTNRPGGYKKLKEILGYAPPIVACQAEPTMVQAVTETFREMGARMFVQHGRACNLGDRRDGAYIRPEHVDLKLFQHVGEPVADLLDQSFAEARRSARGPSFVGIKMHDNDFFAEKSAWVTVYSRQKRPEWDPKRRATPLTAERQAAVWKQYEAMVAHVADKKVKAVNSTSLLSMLEGKKRDSNPGPTPPRAAQFCISGTMHIETKRDRWPDVDRLLAFFRRATATGMKWSIGADIGWLRGEARAAEVIRATEALGVEWDVHAHQASDRAECYDAIRKMGGHPNHVASGAQIGELDSLRQGARWKADVVWGLVRAPNHRPGSDDDSFGLWRPKSGREWETHDPSGGVISVGGGTRRLTDIEAYAKAWKADSGVSSATVMVSPATLTVTRGGEDIRAIEEWAARVGKLERVQWATIRETAEAWAKSGGAPTRAQR